MTKVKIIIGSFIISFLGYILSGDCIRINYDNYISMLSLVGLIFFILIASIVAYVAIMISNLITDHKNKKD